MTGDGEIIVNYHTLSSLLNGCTVGIEDAEGAGGLEYLYNGIYDSLAIPLEGQFSVKFTTGSVPLGVEGSASVTLPEKYYLTQNYPNPFNPQTKISYKLAEQSSVTLNVYDVNGRLVSTLLRNVQQSPGSYSIQWLGRNDQGRNASSGTYILRMAAGDVIQSQKVLLMR